MLGKAAWGTNQGKVRSRNEDAVFFDPDKNHYAIADGMGGLPFGKQAAEKIVELLSEKEELSLFGQEKTEEYYVKLVCEISHTIMKMGNREFKMPYYGSTLTGIQLFEKNAVVYHVGDSRLYQLKHGKNLIQITRDETLYELLSEKEKNEMKEEQKNGLKNQLSQYMGMYPEVYPRIYHLILEEGDKILLCSDGLYNMVSEEEITEVLMTEKEPEEKVKELISRANEAGGKDNISLVILESFDFL